jgi:hypothetical protein
MPAPGYLRGLRASAPSHLARMVLAMAEFPSLKARRLLGNRLLWVTVETESDNLATLCFRRVPNDVVDRDVCACGSPNFVVTVSSGVPTTATA